MSSIKFCNNGNFGENVFVRVEFTNGNKCENEHVSSFRRTSRLCINNLRTRNSAK